jgi:hypothetical protein
MVGADSTISLPLHHTKNSTFSLEMAVVPLAVTLFCTEIN